MKSDFFDQIFNFFPQKWLKNKTKYVPSFRILNPSEILIFLEFFLSKKNFFVLPKSDFLDLIKFNLLD